MTLTKLRIIARRRWPLVAFALVLSLAAMFAITQLTDDDSATVILGSEDPDSYVATGVVTVDRSKLFDSTLDLGLRVLEVEAAGLYEAAADELRPPGGAEALRESTRVFTGPMPGLDPDQDETDRVEREVVIVQSGNLDAETALLQSDTIASTWASLAAGIETNELATHEEEIRQRLAVVDQELAAFDTANPRIRSLTEPEQLGDLGLITTRRGLISTFESLSQQLEQQSPFDGVTAFAHLRTQEPVLVSDLPGNSDDSSALSSIAKWVLLVATGLGLAIALVWALEKLFPRVDTRDDIQDELGIPVLAEVPHVRRPSEGPHTLADLHGPDIEMYRSLRSSLEFIASSDAADAEGVTNGNGHRRSDVIMIVSPTPSEGKTRSAALLGLTYAEAGHDVAILGCDFRRPKLHDYFGVERDPGLGSLVTNGTVEIEDVVKRTNVEGLSVVPSGEPTNKAVPIVEAVSLLIDEARDSGVDVIIDTAPLLVANDAADLVEYADQVVMVVRAGKTHLNAAKEAIEILKRHDAPIAGAVVVASHPADGGYYSYYQRYGYYEHDEQDENSQNGTGRRLPWRRRRSDEDVRSDG